VRIQMSLAVFQSIGPLELLIVLGIVLIIFGPKRLPSLGRQLGAGMREFKDSISRKGDDEDDEDDDEQDKPAALARPEDQAAPSSVSDGVTSEPR
jgi:sec-independent protein translocase protein TatA